jgi:hypothetical protein
VHAWRGLLGADVRRGGIDVGRRFFICPYAYVNINSNLLFYMILLLSETNYKHLYNIYWSRRIVGSLVG